MSPTERLIKLVLTILITALLIFISVWALTNSSLFLILSITILVMMVITTIVYFFIIEKQKKGNSK